MNIILIILGLLSITYDGILIILNPGTFWDIVFSFNHIWLVLGAYLIFLGIYRIKTGHSFWRSWKKWVKISVAGILSLALVISLINLIFILTPQIVSVSEPAEQVILLGGGIDKNGKLPASVMTRVNKAAEYLKKNPDTICVVSGGTLHWLPYPEAPEMKRQLVLAGIAEERILIEDQAKDTIQNFQFSCRILAEHKGVSTQEVLNTPTAVVTTNYHLRRSERLARRIGYTNIKGIPAPCPAVYVPCSYVREICAYVKLNLRIMLTGEPGILSD